MNKRAIYALIGMIAAELLFTCLVFRFIKGGFHSDEIWSYGLANSSGQPFIFQEPGISIDEGSPEDYINLHQWLPGDTLREYITVQPEERFDFGSVWENQKLDHHPPLYYLLLHSLCSLRPESFSWGFGLAISLVCLAVTQVFLFLTARLLMSDRLALAVCGLYACSQGALMTFTFIRQYSLLTALGMMLLCFTARYCTGGQLRSFLFTALPTALALFFTHYFGLVYAAALTACLCLWLFARRRIWEGLACGFSMLGAAGVFLAVWPAALRHMGDYPRTGEGFLSGLGQLWQLISEAVTGMRLMPALVITAALCLFVVIKRRSAAVGIVPVIIAVTSLCLTSAVVFVSDIDAMGSAAVRYAFMLLPSLMLLLVMLCSKALEAFPKLQPTIGRVCAGTAALGLLLSSLLSGNRSMLFINKPVSIDAAEVTRGAVCEAILPEGEEWKLTCLAGVFPYADKLFVTTSDRLADDLPAIDAEGPEYILCFEELPGCELIGELAVCNSRYYLCRRA